MAKAKLSKSMTVTQFENGYWYATELKHFAFDLGIPSPGKLRKDELEEAIICYLETGTIPQPIRRNPSRVGIRDHENGLSLMLAVVNYTNNKETKDFLEREARRIAPDVKRKSGARYRLNRWREEQIARGVRITYGDLVKEYVRLNQTEGGFARIPHGRYINFVADFLAAEPNATREQAIEAWKELKVMDTPKAYRSWVEFKSQEPD